MAAGREAGWQQEQAVRQVEDALTRLIGPDARVLSRGGLARPAPGSTTPPTPGPTLRFRLERSPLAVKVLLDQEPIPFEVLPDGLKSIPSWLVDLLRRMERFPWATPQELTRQPVILLLDEVEVHLHPAWQRKVLPLLQELLPNAQIFASTHSPFVVASVGEAWIYPIELQQGRAHPRPPLPSQLGQSHATVLRDVFGVEEFDPDTEQLLTAFREQRARCLQGQPAALAVLRQLADQLTGRSVELEELVALELRQVERRLRAMASRP